MRLQAGQNIPLDAADVHLVMRAVSVPPGYEIDSCAFALGNTGKVPGDEAFIFYGQPTFASGAVSKQTDGSLDRFTVRTSQLPAGIEKIAFAMTIHQGLHRGQSFGNLQTAFLCVESGGRMLAEFPLDCRGRMETALILGELYKRNGQWKLRAVGQGFNGGLGPLATQFGVDIVDDPDREASSSATPSPAPGPQPAPQPRIRLEKITLEKKQPISLEKGAKGFGEILINLNWSRNRGGKRGLAGLFSAGNNGIDLDLGCMLEHHNGYRDVVQALGKRFGSVHSLPYAQLMGDDRTGDNSDGEWLKINGTKWDSFKRVLIFAFIYEGVPNWAAADGVVTIKIPNRPELVVKLDSHSTYNDMCAIALLENDSGNIRATKLIDYFSGHEPMDRAYGFGFHWRAGQK